MERTLTVTEAARNFSDLINRAFYRGESTRLIRSGEVVAKIVPVAGDTVLGCDLAERWDSLPHLSKREAESFAKDISDARDSVGAPQDRWD